MHPFKAIGLKLISALLFAAMSALVRQLGDVAPIGQMVFFRSAFAIVPVVVIYAIRGELASAVRTGRPLGQLGRGMLSVCGMFTNFSALTRLPLADATAISFASPAHYRGACRHRAEGACAHLPLVGGPDRLRRRHRDADPAFRYWHLCARLGGTAAAVGSLFAHFRGFCNAGTVIQTRRLTQSETTSSIVFYFSLVCAHRRSADAAVCLAFAERARACRAHCAWHPGRPRAYLSDRKLSLRRCIGSCAL